MKSLYFARSLLGGSHNKQAPPITASRTRVAKNQRRANLGVIMYLNLPFKTARIALNIQNSHIGFSMQKIPFQFLRPTVLVSYRPVPGYQNFITVPPPASPLVNSPRVTSPETIPTSRPFLTPTLLFNSPPCRVS